MKSALELIDELNTLDEHPSVEAKKGSSAGSSIMETVCAFANEPDLGGGYLLLGVAPAIDSFWPTYDVVGVPDPDQLQQDIASNCATQFNVAVRPRIVPEVVHDKTVVVVYVPEAGPREKPVYFKHQPLPQGARRRIGSTDQRCTEDDLTAFYTDRQGETYDEQVVESSSLRDIDDEAIEFYRKLRREVDPDAEELSWSQPDLLEALGAVKYFNGERTPTVAGILSVATIIPDATDRLYPCPWNPVGQGS